MSGVHLYDLVAGRRPPPRLSRGNTNHLDISALNLFNISLLCTCHSLPICATTSCLYSAEPEMASSLLSVVSFLSLIDISYQQNDSGKVTCYSWTGQPFDNNTICPGSDICCNTADLCNPNRFCQAHNQTIVPACAVFPWNNCANICQYGRDPCPSTQRGES